MSRLLNSLKYKLKMLLCDVTKDLLNMCFLTYNVH